MGTQQGVGLNPQPLQDGGDVVRGAGPAGVGDQVVRSPIAQTGRREDHEGHPTGCDGGDGPREHGARVAIEQDEAPPCDPRPGKNPSGDHQCTSIGADTRLYTDGVGVASSAVGGPHAGYHRTRAC